MIQVSKPDWPKPFQNGIHFEIWADRANMIRHKGMMLFLDIEDATDGKEDVIEAMWRILMPYEKAGLLWKSIGCKMRPQKTWRFFEEVLPLCHSLCSRDLSNALQKLASISWAIDQALFVKGGKPVWRTDFLPGQSVPNLKWKGAPGGQVLADGAGLLGSTCIQIDGAHVGNYNEWEGCKTDIMILGNTKVIQNGDELYVSVVVRTAKNSRLWFFGEGRRDLPDGKRAFPPLCDWTQVCVPQGSGWQHVGCRVRTKSPSDYDFSRDGTHLYLRTQTDDPLFSIGAIEIGRC